MERDQFDQFISEAKQKGFHSVVTMGGPLPIDMWRPYGCFDGGNPGIERHMEPFVWVSDNQAINDHTATDTRLAVGVWTFA